MGRGKDELEGLMGFHRSRNGANENCGTSASTVVDGSCGPHAPAVALDGNFDLFKAALLFCALLPCAICMVGSRVRVERSVHYRRWHV